MNGQCVARKECLRLLVDRREAHQALVSGRRPAFVTDAAHVKPKGGVGESDEMPNLFEHHDAIVDTIGAKRR